MSETRSGAPRMPHLAPAWLTLPRVTMGAIGWVPAACALPIVLANDAGPRALPLWGLMVAVEGAAAWATVRALGRSFDRKFRSWLASVLTHALAFAVMFVCVVGASDGATELSRHFATYAIVLLTVTVQNALLMSLWTTLLVGVAAMRPRVLSLNAADRTLAVLGAIVTVPCAIVTMFAFMHGNTLGAICLAVTLLPPLLAACSAALRVWSWRRWLERVRAGDDARWRITATEGERGTLCAVDAPAQPFREAEILIPVALIDRR